MGIGVGRELECNEDVKWEMKMKRMSILFIHIMGRREVLAFHGKT